MNKQLKQQAEKIFRANWPKSKMKISHKEFIEGFPTLYNTQIIPSIVQALEMDEFIKEDNEERKRLNDALEEHHKLTSEKYQNSISKIHPGQKLKDGDWFKGSNMEYEQVLSIFTNRNGKEIRRLMEFSGNGLVYLSGLILSSIPNHDLLEFRGKVKYSFPDFKQLCENTFGNGN